MQIIGCITWVIHQQLSVYKVEVKLRLGVCEQKRLNITDFEHRKMDKVLRLVDSVSYTTIRTLQIPWAIIVCSVDRPSYMYSYYELSYSSVPRTRMTYNSAVCFPTLTETITITIVQFCLSLINYLSRHVRCTGGITPPIWTSALDWSKNLASRPGRFIPGEGGPVSIVYEAVLASQLDWKLWRTNKNVSFPRNDLRPCSP
jgi:hypothetical protein